MRRAENFTNIEDLFPEQDAEKTQQTEEEQNTETTQESDGQDKSTTDSAQGLEKERPKTSKEFWESLSDEEKKRRAIIALKGLSVYKRIFLLTSSNEDFEKMMDKLEKQNKEEVSLMRAIRKTLNINNISLWKQKHKRT